MKRLAILEAKVQNIEGGVKLWVETKLENQDRWLQVRLDAFEQQITHQLGSSQTLDVAKVKADVAKIKKIVDELFDSLFIPAPVVLEVEPDIQV